LLRRRADGTFQDEISDPCMLEAETAKPYSIVKYYAGMHPALGDKGNRNSRNILE
jgi:hypothetical protein